jgi:hypothetical protein
MLIKFSYNIFSINYLKFLYGEHEMMSILAFRNMGMKKMNHERKTAIIVGILFLIATVILIVGGVFSLCIYEDNYLSIVSTNENQIIFGALLEIVSTAAIVGIPIAMFPLLKKYSETLALSYVATRIFEGLTIFLNTIVLLAILSLSKEYVASPIGSDVFFYPASGAMLLAIREWGSLLVDVSFPLGAVLFNYLLLKTKITPRWLALLGLIGGALWFATTPIRMFGFSPEWMEFLAAPIAFQEMILATWLIVKGFNHPEGQKIEVK